MKKAIMELYPDFVYVIMIEKKAGVEYEVDK